MVDNVAKLTLHTTSSGEKKYALEKSVNGKTSSIIIIDTEGDGIDNNDICSVDGDGSVFTKKDLEEKLFSHYRDNYMTEERKKDKVFDKCEALVFEDNGDNIDIKNKGVFKMSDLAREFAPKTTASSSYNPYGNMPMNFNMDPAELLKMTSGAGDLNSGAYFTSVGYSSDLYNSYVGKTFAKLFDPTLEPANFQSYVCTMYNDFLNYFTGKITSPSIGLENKGANHNEGSVSDTDGVVNQNTVEPEFTIDKRTKMMLETQKMIDDTRAKIDAFGTEVSNSKVQSEIEGTEYHPEEKVTKNDDETSSKVYRDEDGNLVDEKYDKDNVLIEKKVFNHNMPLQAEATTSGLFSNMKTKISLAQAIPLHLMVTLKASMTKTTVDEVKTFPTNKRRVD